MVYPVRKQDLGRGFAALSPCERDVVACICLGMERREIAETRAISTKTFDTHRNRILKKLGVRTNVALMRLAIREGFVSMHDDEVRR